MLVHTRAHWLRFAALVTLALALNPDALVAQTRKVPVESLIYDLKNPDPVRRQAAARELGAARYQAATPDLVELAHDPIATVRREVELSLENMADMRALPGFVAFASDLEDDIRARAVASLVSLHLPRVTGLTAKLVRLGELVMLSPEPDLEQVVEPDIPVDPIVISTLIARIGDLQRGIRRTAIRGLGILRAKPAVADLVRVVREDRDDGLRFDAARSLRKIGDASVGDELVALLNINGDAVRNELMETLGAMRHHGAVPELTRIVSSAARTDGPRVIALAALADIADPSSVPLFEQLRDDKNEPLRLYANEGLARTAMKENKTSISAARLTEKSPRVRTAQAFGLLRIGETEYLDELVRALDRDLTRGLAKEYLLETSPTDREALFAPREAKPSTRAELAEVLGRMGDPNALPRLQEMANDSDVEVAKAAARAAKRIAVAPSSQ